LQDSREEGRGGRRRGGGQDIRGGAWWSKERYV